MWNELSRMRNRELSEYYVKKYARVSEKMRDTKLPDNIDPQMYATRLNTFLNDINPFLDIPYDGARLGRFIIGTLPTSLDSDGRALLRELTASDTLKDEDIEDMEAQWPQSVCMIKGPPKAKLRSGTVASPY